MWDEATQGNKAKMRRMEYQSGVDFAATKGELVLLKFKRPRTEREVLACFLDMQDKLERHARSKDAHEKAYTEALESRLADLENRVAALGNADSETA